MISIGSQLFYDKQMKKILITGSTGFIGSALCYKLSLDNKVIGVDIAKSPDDHAKITWEQADLTDFNSVTAICEKYSPDVVIHCAGIAHQKIGAVSYDTYMRVNSEATENLAKAATESNPDVSFIFLSSVSVYGEENLSAPVSEESVCYPSSDYATSKLDAEERLISLSYNGMIRNLVILRLAPVYDRDWSFNLDRRVLAPFRMAYIRFGNGLQKMSALARPNLVDFVEFIIHRLHTLTQIKIFNVSDAAPYEFNTIVRIFKKSAICPNRPVISVPLSFVWFATRTIDAFFPKKRRWIHSCYDKLAYDLVIDNGKMMGTEFRPIHTPETIFLS